MQYQESRTAKSNINKYNELYKLIEINLYYFSNFVILKTFIGELHNLNKCLFNVINTYQMFFTIS